jgi:hypothetical protein
LSKASFWSVLAQAGGDQASEYRVAILESRLSPRKISVIKKQQVIGSIDISRPLKHNSVFGNKAKASQLCCAERLACLFFDRFHRGSLFDVPEFLLPRPPQIERQCANENLRTPSAIQ